MSDFNPKPKKREVRESDVEKRHMARVKAAGGASLKFTSPARRAVPDRIDLYGIEPMVAVLNEFAREHCPSQLEKVTLRRWARVLLAAGIQFTELKKPGQKPTDSQHREHERLRAMGFTVNVIDNVDGEVK